jgi:zinc protease
VAIAADAFGRLLYGSHILAGSPLGTLASVEAVTIDALRAHHARALVPGLAAFHAVGAVSERDVTQSLAGLAARWKGAAVPLPSPPVADPSRAGLHFIDVPNSSQSVVRIGYLGLTQTDPDYYPATVMNFRLGGGGFASDLTQVLREQRGYTYGIGSGFSGTGLPGPFQIFSSVRSNVTYEALELVKAIVQAHGPEFDAEDLDATKSYLLRANARAFETGAAKLGLLSSMSAYDFPADYVIQREQIVREMTVERIAELADRYLDPAGMVWLVVGDARTQLPRLRALGLGEPVVLDREGVPVG